MEVLPKKSDISLEEGVLTCAYSMNDAAKYIIKEKNRYKVL